MRRTTIIMLSAAAIAFMIAVLASLRGAAPPLLHTPNDNSVIVYGKAGDPPYEFRWRHGGYAVRYPFRWKTANHFVVCVKEDDQMDFPCAYPAQVPTSGPPWVEDAANIPSTTGRAGNVFAEATRTYTLTIDTLSTSLMDRDLMWTAAACASTSPNSCNYATPPNRFRILGRNLVALDIQEAFAGGSTVQFDFDIENNGPNHSGPFQFKWHVAQMMEDQQFNPRRDVNASDIDPNTDRVMLISTGQVVLINTLPQVSGGYDGSDVWGILERNGFEQSNTVNHAGLASGANDTSTQILNITGPTVVSGQATSIGMSLIVDPSGAVQEMDESDNVHVKEEDYFF